MPSQPSAPCQGRSNAGRTASQLARQISDPLFCDRPSCDPGGDRSNHPHSCNDDSGPGQNARPSIAFDCNCGFSLFFEEPRYSITNVLGWKQVGIMLKDQPKLWWPDRFEKATEVLTFLSHAYTPGAQFGVILAGVAGSRRRRHPLGPRGVERPLANGARCRAFGQKEGVPRRPFFCCSSATGPNKRAVGVREPRAKGTPRHNRTRDQGYVTAGLKGDGSMLHGQGNSAASDPHVIPFAKGSKSSPVDVADPLAKQAKRFCNCSTERPALRKKTADPHWRRLKNFLIAAQPKIGSPIGNTRHRLSGESRPSGAMASSRLH